jgi:hypothetical protein
MFGTFASRLSVSALAAIFVAAGYSLQDSAGLEFRINVVFLLVVFAVPALGLSSAREVARAWRRLLVLSLLGTLAWDVATAFVAGSRPFLSEWYVVYVSGPAMLMLLFLVHGFVAHWIARIIQPSRRRNR